MQKKTFDELAKATTEIDSMHTEYNRVERERDVAPQKEEHVKQSFDKVFQGILEVPMEVDTPLEDQVAKISESMQGFRTKIVELETRMTPKTPLEERDQREKTISTTVEGIKTLEAYCDNLYKDNT
jgi:predicted  nucleic acid-binding Zn-ribbon protein